MLCPQCQKPAPGGAICDSCGHPVPERESFGGQGSHYVLVLLATSLMLMAVLVLATSPGIGIIAALQRLAQPPWFWLNAVVILAPLALGLYYWALLREEEISITDEGIIRHSHWGNQDLRWKDVVAFERHPILFSDTQVGRIAGLSHVLRDRKIIAKLPTFCYELRTAPGASHQGDGVMRLEPGTIDDLSWLIEIISERIGPPLDV